MRTLLLAAAVGAAASFSLQAPVTVTPRQAAVTPRLRPLVLAQKSEKELRAEAIAKAKSELLAAQVRVPSLSK